MGEHMAYVSSPAVRHLVHTRVRNLLDRATTLLLVKEFPLLTMPVTEAA